MILYTVFEPTISQQDYFTLFGTDIFHNYLMYIAIHSKMFAMFF